MENTNKEGILARIRGGKLGGEAGAKQLLGVNQEAVPIVEKVPRLTIPRAFILLFAISFGPCFLTMDLTTQALNSKAVTASIMGVLVFLFLLNWISMVMLTDVYRYSKLGSYQEVAYVISQGNRGYIYLISVMKTMYCVLTASFCLEYCISYLSIVIRSIYINYVLTGKEYTYQYKGFRWQSYLLYYFTLTIVCILSYKSSKNMQDYTHLLSYSNWMFKTIIVSITMMLVFSVFFSITRYTNFMNKNLEFEGFNLEKEEKQINQDLDTTLEIQYCLGYIPTLAFSNLSAIFYLQILSSIKRYNDNRPAYAIGQNINFLIWAFYLVLFGLILVYQLIYLSNRDNSVWLSLILYTKSFYRSMDLFNDSTMQTQVNIFDIPQFLLCVVLYCHHVVVLFVAKEHVLIYVDEAQNHSMSKMLDDKRYSTGESKHFLLEKPKKENNNDEGNELENSGRDGDEEKKEIPLHRMTYMMLDDKIKTKYFNRVFGIMVLCTTLNFAKVNLLQGLWEIIGAIVCPLVVIVLPGVFYYTLQRQLDQKGDNPWKSRFGAMLAVFGLIMLPVLLTLATKNIFDGNNYQELSDLVNN